MGLGCGLLGPGWYCDQSVGNEKAEQEAERTKTHVGIVIGDASCRAVLGRANETPAPTWAGVGGLVRGVSTSASNLYNYVFWLTIVYSSSAEGLMAGSYNGVPVPANGARITYSNGTYQVPENPIVPFI